MMFRTLLVAFTLTLAGGSLHAAENQLTAAEKSAGWQLLFDGKTLNGWRTYGAKTPPSAAWEVKDGTLRTVAKMTGRNDIITEQKFDDFELSWEWRMSKAGNNGIKYFVTEARTKSPGHEYQMLDDLGHPDSKIGAHRQTASFYDVLAPAADKPLKPVGEWNTSRIVVKGMTVEHWLNGKNVLTYTLGSPEVKAGLAKSKFAKDAGFGDKISGHIMLTYHSDECWFRNIKIRPLK